MSGFLDWGEDCNDGWGGLVGEGLRFNLNRNLGKFSSFPFAISNVWE